MKSMKKNQTQLNLLNLIFRYSSWYKYYLLSNFLMHLFIALCIGSLEVSPLSYLELGVTLVVLFLLIFLNIFLFFLYTKEKEKRKFKNNNTKSIKVINKSSILCNIKPGCSVTDIIIFIFKPWIMKGIYCTIFIFGISYFYYLGVIPCLTYCLTLDRGIQSVIFLFFLLVGPQVLLITFFINKKSFLEIFYLFLYFMVLRFILFCIILYFVRGYNLELSEHLLFILSTGIFSTLGEIDLFLNINTFIKDKLINVIDSIFLYFSNILDCFWKILYYYSVINREINLNSRIPFFSKKEISDWYVNSKFYLKNIVPVTTRCVSSTIDSTREIHKFSGIILEITNFNKNLCSYKLLGGASSSDSNFNSLIFPSEPLLSDNQTFFQYLVSCRDREIFSNKFVDLFLNNQHPAISFNRYKNSIIQNEHKFILSLFAPLFLEQNKLFCFGLTSLGDLVPVPYKKIFYNDKPNLSLYKLIGVFDTEEDMIRESDLCINQRNSDHWVSGTQRDEARNKGRIWKSYCHLEELENVPTYFSNQRFSSLRVSINSRYMIYDPDNSSHERKELYLLIDGKFYSLPFLSPAYLNVHALGILFELKHAEKIKSFYLSYNRRLRLEE